MKYAFSCLLISLIALSTSWPQNQKPADVQTDFFTLPESFPTGKYTPYGYIDNPYHSMVLHRSGVIRSVPPLGFGYWKRSFKGSYAEGPRGHLNYLSFLQFTVNLDGATFLDPDDFRKNEVELYSAYHTKNAMSYDWEFHEVRFRFLYYLPRENTLACRVEMRNTGDREKRILLHATNIYGLWEIKWWGSNGLSSLYLPDKDVSVQKIWAYGDVFVLGSNWQSSAHKSTENEDEWRKWARTADMTSNTRVFQKGKGPVYAVQSYEILLPPHSKKSAVFYLSRGKNQEWTLAEFKVARAEAMDKLGIQLTEDDRFWSDCPKLAGDWPDFWKHGWVYDWETLRMNVRPPIGIFKHPWDGMQVHSPRLVLGETALDMMTMSYANPSLAREVMYGTFADALAPNVPCAREDGSVNMIGADGSECGTAPMWGFPFHVIHSIYQRSGDDAWIRKLYPHLKAYLQWWLQNRTDEQGWFHCNNSWESGQDGSQRFLVEGEGDPAEFVRTVDVEASVAEAMKRMEEFAVIAGKPEDQSDWKKLAETRIRNTRSMFVDGWFRDIDGRNGQPIFLEDFYDPIMLAPLTCGIATPEQMDAVKPKLDFIRNHKKWLQWPPGVMAFTEAAWTAGKQLTAARAVTDIANRIYRRTDSRQVMFVDQDKPFAYWIPGVANEFWPVDFKPPASENYGWGATLPGYIIRDIAGFRETSDGEGDVFFVAPAFPEEFLQNGSTYTITSLHYRNIRFDLTYTVKGGQKLTIQLKCELPSEKRVLVLTDTGDTKFESTLDAGVNRILFSAQNGNRYRIIFTEKKAGN